MNEAAMKNYLKKLIDSRPEQYITFAEYMETCLYAPEYGYYMKAKQKIGKQGDFYTSSTVHPVFAETIALFIEKVTQKWSAPDSINFIEMGAGTGLFATQLLDALRTHNRQLYESITYIILEKSPYHIQLQEEQLEPHSQRVQWVSQISELPSTGVVFANELFDAFPVHLVQKRNGTLFEKVVRYDEMSDSLKEDVVHCTNTHISDYLHEHKIVLTDGQALEIPLAAQAWMKKTVQHINEGLFMTFDYGYTNEELQLPQHRQGSLLCYHNHQVDDRYYEKPGEKDITYHVHFDALRNNALENGWKLEGLFPQTEFLMMCGILNLLEEHQATDPFQNSVAKKNRAIRQLISPEGISGAFKVLMLTKLPVHVSDLFKYDVI